MRGRAWPMIGLISKWSMTSQISRPLERQTDRLPRGEKNGWKCADGIIHKENIDDPWKAWKMWQF